MKNILYAVVAFGLVAATGFSKIKQIPSESPADALIDRLTNEWKNIGVIKYDYKREIHYESIDEFGSYGGSTYLDFNEKNPTMGYRFQFDNPDTKIVYNGSEYFEIDKGKKNMIVKYNPHAWELSNFEFMFNSFLSLRTFLPIVRMRTDIKKDLKDTTFEDRNCFMLQISLFMEKMAHTGTLFRIQQSRTISYRIIIDKKNLFPLMVLCTNDFAKKDYELTRFKNYLVDPVALARDSWFYSSYTGTFPIRMQDSLRLLSIGGMAPSWQTELSVPRGALHPEDIHGKVVLLEFWISNCGYCIENVPRINKLMKTYKDRKFAVAGINSHDDIKMVDRFYQTFSPEFTSGLDPDGHITRQYGVQAFPTIFLLDPEGRVIYRGHFDEHKIKDLIDEYIH